MSKLTRVPPSPPLRPAYIVQGFAVHGTFEKKYLYIPPKWWPRGALCEVGLYNIVNVFCIYFVQ